MYYIVSSDWPIKTVKDYKSIILLEDNSETNYIDFDILNNNENLLFFQFKKTLKKRPKNDITRKIIEDKKFY